MGVYDQSARFATNEEPDAVIARLTRDELAKFRFREWTDTRTTATPGEGDLTADRVAVLDEANRPTLMVFEFQSQHDDDKLDVTLAEVARLRLSMRHGPDRCGKYRVLAGMVYLRGTCPAETLDMTTPSGRGTRHAVFVWNVGEDDAWQALADFASGRVPWGILFWVPLMANAGDAALIRLWLSHVEQFSAARQAKLIQVALVFAELAGVLVAWQDALEEWQMKTESPLVNSWIAQGENKARVEERRDSLLFLLNEKFAGQVTPDVIDTINQQPGTVLLRSWFAEAVRAATFAEFVAVLRR